MNNYQLSMTSPDASVYLHPTTYSLVPRLNLGTNPNLDTLLLLVLKNILLFFFILRVKSEDQILNMAFEQIEAFLKKMQSEPELKNEVLAASTADDIARIALLLGFEFSGDELLRMSGKKVGSITVRKTDLPGEYN